VGGVRVDRVRLAQTAGQSTPHTDPYTTYSTGNTGKDHGGRRR
jgi:hypothetical protein